MTSRWRETVPCHQCGAAVSTEPPIKKWIRNHEDLDSQEKCLWIGDSDLWVHRWGKRATRHRGVNRDVQSLMLVEVKTWWQDLDPSQRDTLWSIDQLLRTKSKVDRRLAGMFMTGHMQNARVVHGFRAGKRITLLCYGAHKLRMDGATPDSSSRITWDDKAITREQLLGLLAFEISPDNFRPIEDRVHKRIVDHPALPFGEGT